MLWRIVWMVNVVINFIIQLVTSRFKGHCGNIRPVFIKSSELVN